MVLDGGKKCKKYPGPFPGFCQVPENVEGPGYGNDGENADIY